MYIRIKTSFYVVRRLDSIASYPPTGFYLGLFRSWPPYTFHPVLFFGLPRALFCFGIHFNQNYITLLKYKPATTGQALYVHRNFETRSCNCWCSGTAISIIYSECVFCRLNYPACNAHAPYCHLWPGRLYIIFNIISQKTLLRKVPEHKMCV